MKELIEKYAQRLNNLKNNRAELVDQLSDVENDALDKQIEMVAEFVRDLKSVS